MATKKVKKFGRGGDILTGLGAGLAGYGIYKALTKGKDQDDDYTRRVKEYGTKGRFPEEKTEEKAKPKREEYVAADKEENESKKEALSKGMQYKKPEKSTVVEKAAAPKAAAPKAAAPKAAAPKAAAPKANVGDSDSSSTPSSADDVISAGQKYARIGEKNKPYPSNLPAVKDAQHRQFLQKKAGLSGKGITTPGDSNKKGDTSKGRSANPIQGTIDNAGKSMARTPQQKMSEGAREVQRRREEAEKSRYKKGGSVSSASKRADGIAIRGKTRA